MGRLLGPHFTDSKRRRISMSTNQTDLLNTEPVGRIFMKYLIPSLVGMMIMALNIVIDGVMVGNRLGATALAGVGIRSEERRVGKEGRAGRWRERVERERGESGVH